MDDQVDYYYDDVNSYEEDKDAINEGTEDISETLVNACGDRRTNQFLHYNRPPAAGAAANLNARVMRLRGSYLCDHDVQGLNAHPLSANTNIPRLDEFSDDSFEYPETSGDNNTYDDVDDQECDDTRDNNSKPPSPFELIAATKHSVNKKWTDEDYPAITWITSSGDSVVEMLIRRSQRMALLLLVATIVVAMLSIWTLRHTITTPPFRSCNNGSLVAEMKEMHTMPADVSTQCQQQLKRQNTTPQIVLNQVDAHPKATIDQANRETSLSVWTATKKVFSTNVRLASDDQRSFSRVQLPLQAAQDKTKHTKMNNHISTSLVPFTPFAYDTKQANQLTSLEDMLTIRWGILPAMIARSSFSSLETNGLADPRSIATATFSQMTARTKSGLSISSVSHPNKFDTLPQGNQRKIPPLLRRLLLLFGKDQSTSKSHLDVMATVRVPRSFSGTIPLYVAQLSSLQLSSAQMYDVVPPPKTTATTTITTVSLLDLIAARLNVVQKRLAEWLSSNRDSTRMPTSTSIVVDSQIEIGNPGLWGTIPSNLGHSSLLLGLFDQHFTVVEQFFQESSQERERRRTKAPLSAGEEEEEESSIRKRSSKLRNDSVMRDLALIQSWMMTPAGGLAGTISKIGPSAIQIGMYLQV